MIIFLICKDVLNCLRSVGTIVGLFYSHNSRKWPFFAVLKYSLYGYLRNFKFKLENPQYGPCFQSIFPFLMTMLRLQGRIQRFWKGVALCVGHHVWPTKKILGLRWSKKAKIMIEAIDFWKNISISIIKFSLFLYNESLPKKSYQLFKIW